MVGGWLEMKVVGLGVGVLVGLRGCNAISRLLSML